MNDTIHSSGLVETSKRDIRSRFNQLAGSRDRWQKKNRFYYEELERYIRFLVPEGKKVLEVGCGLGDLLAAVKPAYGLGIDISEKMVEEACKRHPGLEFEAMNAEELELVETFDAIILSDVVGHIPDVQKALQQLRKCCVKDTRIVISYYNILWEPVLKLAEMLGLKMPQQHQNWLSPADISNLLHLTGFEVVKTERRLLLPRYVPLLSGLCNRFLAFLPGFRKLCLCNYLVARPLGKHRQKSFSTSVVIPCRNEKGNIEAAIQRMPRFGKGVEIIFVDGHSTDGTPDEIQRVIRKYPKRDIKFLVQDGEGKGDAVRKGFSRASGDILMILDADLTVPPEDLPKFYKAIASGQGEFINGCRLVYPMQEQAMRLLNMLGNKFFAMAFSWLLNQRIKDTLCGTKVIFRHDYLKLDAGREYFGDFDPFGDFDLLFGASKLNLRIIEIPVRYQDRSYGQTNISRFSHGWLLLKMTFYAFFKLKAV